MVWTWKHGCAPGHTRQPTRETTERRCDMMMVVHFCKDPAWSSAIYQAQCDATLQAGHRRCRCRSWRHGDQLKFRRCWHVRNRRIVFVVRLFRHGPAHGVFGSGLWLDLSREQRAKREARWPLQRPRGIRRRSERVIEAIPCSRPCCSRRGP